jgi:hypothetical protein
MMVDAMHYGPCEVEAARPGSTGSNWRNCGCTFAKPDRERLWHRAMDAQARRHAHQADVGVEFGQTQVWRILGALGFQGTKA